MKINAFTKYIFIIAFTCFLLPILLFGQQGDSIYVMPGSKVVIGDSTINAGAHNNFLLSVSGKTVAKNVSVTIQGWSDDVFEEDYPLMPIPELESYIKTHKHLPDIPSENEIEQNGISSGEFLAKLLRKIEEITLYLIKQNERQKYQDKVLIKLRKENGLLEHNIFSIENSIFQ